MGYALFSQRKLVIIGNQNSSQLQQAQRDDNQFKLATSHSELQRQISALNTAKASELKDLYADLSDAEGSDERDSINAEIQEIQQKYAVEEQNINNQIYEISQKESVLELEKKRLDTVVTKLQKELEAINKAEQTGIENATPKFGGLG